MKNLDVVAIGSCYVDINVPTFPFEPDGIPVGAELIGSSYETVPGGSAVNFCRLLGKLGLDTAFIGIAGNDMNGISLVNLLDKSGILPFISLQDGLQTNIGFNMTSQSGEHIMCVAGTANASLSFDVIEAQSEKAVADARVMYVGGCFKLKSLQHDFLKLSAIAKKHDTLLAVDHGRIPGGTPEELLESVRSLVLSANYYFPSRDEFCALWNVDSIESGIDQLATVAPDLVVVVKDSSNGAYFRRGGTVQHVPAIQITSTIDVTGAGDAFNAGVMRGVLAGQPLHAAVAYGCDVAAAKISRSKLPEL